MKPRIVALSGGVGGAKLALGLARVLPPEDLLVVANTGDDFEHLGYYICPDIDTLLYTLGGINDTERGWGRADETWAFMERLRASSPEDAWFLLGDKDLETHRLRRQMLDEGASLTAVTAALAEHFGVRQEIVPMSDAPVRTQILAEMAEGGRRWLPFQEYFVRRRCEPAVRAIRFEGAAEAEMPGRLAEVLATGPVGAIVVCPSNPYLSVDPILSVRGLREKLMAAGVPVIVVSPVVGGRAIKGPTAKLMRELGLNPDVLAIARHYAEWADGLVIDELDSGYQDAIASLGLRVLVTKTVMQSLQDRESLARDVLAFARPDSAMIERRA